MKRIRHSSIGDYITTLCFFGLTILAFVRANEASLEESDTKAFLLFILSAIFFFAAVRFAIARLFYTIHKLFIERRHETRTTRK